MHSFQKPRSGGKVQNVDESIEKEVFNYAPLPSLLYTK